jgi:hypothetical protein
MRARGAHLVGRALLQPATGATVSLPSLADTSLTRRGKHSPTSWPERLILRQVLHLRLGRTPAQPFCLSHSPLGPGFSKHAIPPFAPPGSAPEAGFAPGNTTTKTARQNKIPSPMHSLVEPLAIGDGGGQIDGCSEGASSGGIPNPCIPRLTRSHRRRRCPDRRQ